MKKSKIIYEKEKKAGVAYAISASGLELPVIDITHPAFMVNPGEKQINELRQKLVADGENFLKIPAWLRKIIIYIMFKRSYLGRGIMASSGTFLDGMSVYLLKLGQENLGKGYATAMDKSIAAGLGHLSLRMRLQDMAREISGGIKPLLAQRPRASLHFVNIAGGPAMDTLNALILLYKEAPDQVRNREIKIHLLDMDSEGPAFARDALNALQSAGAVLGGLKAQINIIKHDWANTAELEKYLRDNIPADAVVAVSSEGGMFDYCPDGLLFANMKAIYDATPADTVLAGTLSTHDDIGKLYNMHSNSTIERSLEAFSLAVAGHGWFVNKSYAEPFGIVIGMRKG